MRLALGRRVAGALGLWLVLGSGCGDAPRLPLRNTDRVGSDRDSGTGSSDPGDGGDGDDDDAGTGSGSSGEDDGGSVGGSANAGAGGNAAGAGGVAGAAGLGGAPLGGFGGTGGAMGGMGGGGTGGGGMGGGGMGGMDPCASNPCTGHETCDGGTGEAVCSCEAPWDGVDCDQCAVGYYEYPASSGSCIDDPCDPDPCNGHGTSCDNVTGSAQCTCTGNWAPPLCAACIAGYTGGDCTTEIDECDAIPCSNAGICSDELASFSCTCQGAWDGTTCDDIYFGDPADQNDALRTSANDCNDETFLDLTDWLPDPNPYTDPFITITCSMTSMTVQSNSVPQYLIDWESPSRTSFANTLVPTTSNYVIPRTPAFNAVPVQATVVGGVGVAVNGVQISSPSASGGPLEYADPTDETIEIDGDLCHGHPNPQGKYHYHSLMTSCLFEDADDGQMMGSACTAPSPLIGWIADGYPMYGPCECTDAECTSVIEMKSSYALQGGDGDPKDCAYQDYTYVGQANEHDDDDEYLDECSGHIGPNGDYHYHATNAYPWTLRCYRGNPMATMAIGHTYNNMANDCCFELQCTDGEYTQVACDSCP